IEAATPPEQGTLRSAWVQLGPGGGIEARAVVEGKACPAVYVDQHERAMQVRAAPDGKFATVCAALIPKEARQAAIMFRAYRAPPPHSGAGVAAWEAWIKEETGLPLPGTDASEADWLAWSGAVNQKAQYHIVPLALPAPDPHRIVVLGDTGCRVKGKVLQDCSDPKAWPFAEIAAKAAKLKPDLVIHVGDYPSRESACPAGFAGCAGTPFGDNWPTWDADFFAPAKPLLAAAPWVFVRGNHEECERAGPGWLRLLGPLPFDAVAPCAAHLAPYSVPLGAENLVVMDDANAPDTSIASNMIAVYRSEIAALANAPSPSWLLLHRPIWGAISGPLGLPIGGNQTLIAAVGTSGIPAPVELMLSGHIHSFEALNYGPKDRVPPQLIAGIGGDRLEPTPAILKGTVFQGKSGVFVKDGLSLPGHGFLLMVKSADGWTINVHDASGKTKRTCFFRSGRIDCPKRD
ncbi:MAG TPA: metallophosphoesterase, partial [Rhizomicrobium sp.]